MLNWKVTLTKSDKSHSCACEIILDKLVQLKKNTNIRKKVLLDVLTPEVLKNKNTYVFGLDVANHVVRTIQGVAESILVGSIMQTFKHTWKTQKEESS